MIGTKNGYFQDRQGRQVLLHGINFVNKDPKAGYLFPESETRAAFADFHRWGLNCVRLGVIWDGLEPEPGVYNEAYLQGIAHQLDAAHENGLYVFLDMHQDLYSALYSDGAPAWATLDEGQPHITGAVWSDAYFASPAVQTALDQFWRNAPAPDGIGLQDHLAACWKLLAGRFGSHPAVIGYDLFNEPMMGAAAPQAMGLQLARGAELLLQTGFLAPDTANPSQAVLSLWLSTPGRYQVLQLLQDPERFATVVEAPAPLYNHFEREQLMPFYQRIAAAIRAVDEEGVLFLETSMGSNAGVYSAIEPLAGPAGRDPQQAYAPHGYDLVVDTPNNADASPERVRLIFTRHAETARKHGWPMLVGEWGAYGFMPGTLPAARQVVAVFESCLCSDTYWAYEKGLENGGQHAACFPAISRPYPERVAGTLERYAFHPETGLFECAWQEDPSIAAPTVIYLPAWFAFDPARLTCEPAESPALKPSVAPASPVQAPPANQNEAALQPGGVWLFFPPTGEARSRLCTIRVNQDSGGQAE